jgi:hypothetical protein
MYDAGNNAEASKGRRLPMTTVQLIPESVTRNIDEYTAALIGHSELLDPIAKSDGFNALLHVTLLNILKNGKGAVAGALAVAYEFGYLHGAKDAGHPIKLGRPEPQQFPDTFSGCER